MSKTIVLGAGFCGMSAGIKLGCPVYEMNSTAGGICTDYVKDGFRFSNGGPHFLFGKDKGLEYIKTLVEVKEYERKAGVYYNHTFPYPFQSKMQEDCGLNDPSLKHWLFKTFGKEQCNMFFYPFNEKYTAGLYNSILPQDEYKSPKTGTGWVSTFCDPVNGLSDLVDKMASKCDIRYNKQATYISIDQKKIFFADGTNEPYERIISTIPLDKMMLICCHPKYHAGRTILPYTSVLVINIGAEPGPNVPSEHWLYIPFCKTGFHRVAFYTNVDKSKAPEGWVGLSVEIAFREEEPSNIWDVITELQDWGWISNRVFTYQVDIVKTAYTWQYNKEDVPDALAWLKERDITSTGRYGKWSFQGLTQSIEDGFNVEV